jgi:hypothetical protein
MPDPLEQVGRARVGAFLAAVPVVAGRHSVGAVERLDVLDDRSDHAPQPVADRDHARAVELRRLDVQQVVEAAVGLAALEDVERRQLAGLLDPKPGLQQQLEQRPVPERVNLARPRQRVARRGRERPLGVLPAPQRQRADGRHGALEVEHGGRLAAGLSAAGLLEPDADEVVALERHRRRRERSEGRAGLGRPDADISEEAADVDQPLMRGQAILVGQAWLAALHFAGAGDRVRNERQQVLAPHVRRPRQLGIALIEERPQVL